MDEIGSCLGIKWDMVYKYFFETNMLGHRTNQLRKLKKDDVDERFCKGGICEPSGENEGSEDQ